ncbi:receptor-like protein kinase FERONIA [Salvia splendens]|uniref:receptor-like protein kinase FERONIA n=1 Tax=Salvia splendens TaxID=180675 RepID=UPI00110094B9|nr:receptor-like protein kinase FERONIA [Salvia splendens]
MDDISFPKEGIDKTTIEDNPSSSITSGDSDQKNGKKKAATNNLTQRWWWDPFGILPRQPSKLKPQEVYKGYQYLEGDKKTVTVRSSRATDSRVSMAHELQTKKEIQRTSSPLQDHVVSLIGICIGAIRGLRFIHSTVQQAMLHRDLKSTNIWLDENWIPKVSGWGLSKKKGNNQVQSIIRSNYVRGEELTEKSCVYSFGLILFEVLFAEKESNRWLDKDQGLLAQWIKSCMRNNFPGCIAPFLVGRTPPDSLKIFIEGADRCLLDYGIDRPSMADIEERLEAALQLQEETEASKGIQPRRS